MAIERWRPRWGLTPWSPFRELEELARPFDDLLSRPFLPSLIRRWPVEGLEWSPAIEIFDKGDKLVVKAELPGMKEDDIDVSVVGDTLTIKGQRKAESDVKEENYCCERSYGSFFRSMTLPSHVDNEKIEATCEDGVLEVSLPKAIESKEKKVKVSSKKG